MRRKAFARITLGLSTTLTAGFLIYQLLTPTYSFLGSAQADTMFGLANLAYAAVGAAVIARQPQLKVGWVLLFAGLAGTATMFFDRYTAYALHVDRAVPLFEVAGWLGGWLWMPADIAITTFLPLLFPTGALPSRRWRPVAWLAAIAMIAPVSQALGQSYVSENFPDLANPYALSGRIGEIVAGLRGPLFMAWAIASVFSIAAVFSRLRRARGVERQQLKWLGTGMALVAISFAAVLPVFLLVGYSPATSYITGIPAVGLTILPIFAGIAILRYRLYDIDVLIRRTLTYAAVSAVLIATYVAAVVLAGAALRPLTAGSDLAVAASTLLVVALFQPVRARVQAAIDHRFYRARYDAARTLDAFTARLRDEVELDAVRADLLRAVRDTVRPAQASLWLREARR